MRDDGRIDRSMDQNDLPIIAGFLEDHTVDALHLIRSLEHVVEAGPAGRPQIAHPEIRDAQFPGRIRG